ncbi:MAG TPA: hypothetical protein VH639_14450 [Bryobacteraceae bacterium]|jgi:hypothetical protein
MSTKHIALGVFALLALQALGAAKEDDWTNLNSLKSGDRIRVIQSSRQTIEGRFQQANDSGITIHVDREITVPRPDVVRVYRHSGRKKTTKILIGAGIGIAAGAILTGTLGDRFRNEGQDVPGALWIAGGAGIGAGIGALLGGNYTTVYRSSPQP